MIAVAVVTFTVWAQYGPEPRLAYALVNAVAVLIIAWGQGRRPQDGRDLGAPMSL